MKKNLLIYLLLIICSISYGQTTVTFTPIKDNSIFSDQVSNSNGTGPLFSGNTCFSSNRRALMQFDISSIPSGSIITAVSLEMNCNLVSLSGSGSHTYNLHTLTQDWGEGTSFSSLGLGATAVAPDATWNNSMTGGGAWTTPGGDFNATSLTSLSMPLATGTYTFPTSTNLTVAIQGWVDTPTSNFGLIMIGDETTSCTARRFGSKDNGVAPVLSVTYTAGCTPTTGTDTEVACDSYTWIDGNTYTSNNNTAKDTLVNAAGCDSVVTLDLTINNSTTGTDIQVACDSYTWIDGNTYYVSNNIATHVLTNSNGCDSIVILDLTVSNTTATFITLSPAKDNSIYSESTNSNGQGKLFSGTTASGNKRRALMQFDFSSIPSGAIITNASLDLTVDQFSGSLTSQYNLHSLTRDWGEGTSSGGGTGATAVAPDATWTDAMLGTTTWTTVGGDFNSTSSAAKIFSNSTGVQSISSTGMVNDIASWIANPVNNYGWILVGDETTNQTARRIGSKDQGTAPILTIGYILPSAPDTTTTTACDSFTMSSGTVITTSGIYNDTLTGTTGCDSVIVYNLTINNSTTGTDTQIACNSYIWIDGNAYTSNNNTATHTLTNATGCDSIVTLNLTINSVSDVTTSMNGVIITATNSNAIYQWLDCDNGNSPISGEFNQAFTATNNGNYAVELTENGCVDTSSCVAITTVGILENNFEDNLSVYPNPTNGKFAINLGDKFGSVKVTITDINGRLIQTLEYNRTKVINIDLNQPSGVYILSLESNEQKAVLKLVKE